MASIGIRFCGGCNSRIDRVKIAEELKVQLNNQSYTVEYNPDQADFWIYLSGCSAACGKRNDVGISISGETIEGIHFSGDQMIDEILLRVRDYFERLAK